MRTNPIPNKLIVTLNTDSPVILAYSYRINRANRVNTFKMKPRMIRIFLEGFIGYFGLLLDRGRQLGKCPAKGLGCMRFHNASGLIGFVLPRLCSRSAASASLLNASSDSEKAFSHRLSETSSSKTQRAKAFCSTAGSLEALANAC